MSDALIGAVRKAWREAAAGAPGTRAWRAVRTTCPGPLSVLAAIRENDGAVALLFETTIENAPSARARFEADGISMLEERNFAERTYRIAVTLERHDLENIFGIVTADLIEAAAAYAAPEAAVTSLFTRLSAWQAFLRARRAGLGRDAIVGLVGELLVLRRAAASAGWSAAVDAWHGPTGGLHDFVRNGHALEVKATAGVAPVLPISSLDQLEDAGLSALLLVHVRLAESPAGPGLSALAASIKAELKQHAPSSLPRFRDALLAAGYTDVDAELYLTPTFQAAGMRFYRVSPGFPRLTRAHVPQGVTEAIYRLDLRAIRAHHIDDNEAGEVMRCMGDLG